ncbi:hypothetical protein BS78_03G162300 [Paspalum vaginatum]|nr:hypothetical protein BS78_03G162300 [Paspalum vaginatum]
METILPTEVVSQVLPKSSTFLQNVDIKLANKTRTGGTSSLQEQQLQAQLEVEKQESAGLRQELDSLKTNAQEAEAKIDSLQKKHNETNAFLRQLISFSHRPKPKSLVVKVQPPKFEWSRP